MNYSFGDISAELTFEILNFHFEFVNNFSVLAHVVLDR